MSSISRLLTPEQALTAAAGAEVEVLDSRRLGGAWSLDRVWERLGIGAAVRRVAEGRRLDGEATERVLFALVAQRALEPFDMRGVEFGHHGADCTFETLLRHHDLVDPVLWRIAAVVHEADLEDDRYDAPEAPGLDAVLRGLSMVRGDDDVLSLTGPLFDGLYEYFKRGLILGKEPA